MPASNPSRTTTEDDPGDLPDRILAVAPRIRSFLRRLCGGATGVGSDVDDLLQDVLERAIRYRHSFDPGAGDLDKWLMKTAFRTYLDQRDRAARQPRTDDAALATASGPSADLAELRDSVGFLLDQLGPTERDVVVRFHRDGETIAEIGAALGMPEGTVKSHLHRARRRLAESRRRSDA